MFNLFFFCLSKMVSDYISDWKYYIILTLLYYTAFLHSERLESHWLTAVLSALISPSPLSAPLFGFICICKWISQTCPIPTPDKKKETLFSESKCDMDLKQLNQSLNHLTLLFSYQTANRLLSNVPVHIMATQCGVGSGIDRALSFHALIFSLKRKIMNINRIFFPRLWSII